MKYRISKAKQLFIILSVAVTAIMLGALPLQASAYTSVGGFAAACADGGTGPVCADNLPKVDPSSVTIARIMSFVFALAGIISLLIMTLAGFRYVISRGDPENIKKAKNTIIYAAVGLAITMSAYGIVTFVYGRVK
jgi:Type IV secretion system pilin